MLKARNIEITAFGETREVEFYVFDDSAAPDRLTSAGGVVVGKFPTGTKLHRTQLTLWKRNQSYRVAGGHPPLRGETAAVVDGEEYVMDAVLYTHNRNSGRICGWHESVMSATRQGW